jgi:protein-L-isoaspartate(D-aspartate) O-methyltransferase
MSALDGLLERRKLADQPLARAALRRQVAITGVPASVVEAMAAVPRHAFVPAALSRTAYVASGNWLPSGAALPGPAITARILSALDPQPGERVLEVGTGCGYLTVLLALLAREVVTVDTVDRTDGVLEAAGLANIQRGAMQGEFDAVLVGVPQPVFGLSLLAGARRGVMVVGPPLGTQRLLLARTDAPGAAPELLDLGPVLLPAWTFGAAPLPILLAGGSASLEGETTLEGT